MTPHDGTGWLILHHVGDGNVPGVRMRGTVALHRELSMRGDYARVLVLEGPEADALRTNIGQWAIVPFTDARSTVGEIIASRRLEFVNAPYTRTLIISTEQGHRRRAYLAARIIYAFTGVTVIAADYPGGTYRSPPWEWCRDVLAATWWKLTHRIRAR